MAPLKAISRTEAAYVFDARRNVAKDIEVVNADEGFPARQRSVPMASVNMTGSGGGHIAGPSVSHPRKACRAAMSYRVGDGGIN